MKTQWRKGLKKEHKRATTKGTKSRLNWAGVCLKDCANRDKKCDKCLRFSEYEETEK